MTRSLLFSPGEPSEIAAAAWLARVEPEWTVADEAAFQAWLDKAKEHRQAYASVCASMDLLNAHADTPEIAAVRRRAVNRARPRRRALLIGSLAATLALVVGVVAYQGREPTLMTYETARSTREVTLADGSRVTLDARTVLEARIGRKARDLRLMQGQASFEVAHDRQRPFSVRLGPAVVVATGTVFNLEQAADASTITLVQGGVDVRSAQDGEVLARLAPGDQYLVRHGRGRMAKANSSAALAWRSGKIIFDDTSLAEAVARIGRYAASPLRVSPAVADLRISGAFNAGDEAVFVRAVEAYLPVQAAEGPDGVVELRQRPSP